MPNTSEGQGAHLSGPAEPSRLHRPSDVEDERGLIGSFARDAARGRRASSAELHLPWTCPVTHSREKFYTVCSDHALLNQAASVYRPPNTNRELVLNKQDDAQSLGTPKPSAEVGAAPSGGALLGPEVDCDLMEVSSGNRAPILAWEIDTTDFNAVLTRKTRAGNDNEDLLVLEPFLLKTLQIFLIPLPDSVFFILRSRQLKEMCQQEDETAGETQPESARRVPSRLPGRDQTEESV